MNVVGALQERTQTRTRNIPKLLYTFLRFNYDHQDLSTMFPCRLYVYGGSTTLFLRLYPDCC
jgi:hypothetical protein